MSRVQLECGRLEVCLLPEEVEKYQGKPKIPVSSLQVGQVVEGRVFKLRPYGVIVDIGANRNALLHIRKVAKLYGKYIDEEKGLYEAGLERGARVRLAIESMDDKRLFLDFTEETKASSVPDQESSSESTATATQNNQVMPDEELDEMAVSAEESSKQSSVKIESKTEGTTAPSQNDQGVSKEELSAWAEYANQSENSDEADDDDDDDYDDYDEQRDIEDSLGLGFY